MAPLGLTAIASVWAPPGPTVIAVPAVLDESVIGVTVPSWWLVTNAFVPSGVIAIASGPWPTVIVEVAPFDSVMTVTVPAPLPL